MIDNVKRLLSSRKGLVGLTAAGLLTGALLLGRVYSLDHEMYSTYCTSIVALAGLFMGSNVYQKITTKKDGEQK